MQKKNVQTKSPSHPLPTASVASPEAFTMTILHISIQVNLDIVYKHLLYLLRCFGLQVKNNTQCTNIWFTEKVSRWRTVSTLVHGRKRWYYQGSRFFPSVCSGLRGSLTSGPAPLCLRSEWVSGEGSKRILEATPMPGEQAVPSLCREEIVSAMIISTKPKLNGFLNPASP